MCFWEGDNIIYELILNGPSFVISLVLMKKWITKVICNCSLRIKIPNQGWTKCFFFFLRSSFKLKFLFISYIRLMYTHVMISSAFLVISQEQCPPLPQFVHACSQQTNHYVWWHISNLNRQWIHATINTLTNWHHTVRNWKVTHHIIICLKWWF